MMLDLEPKLSADRFPIREIDMHSNRPCVFALLVLSANLLASTPATAADFYVDPVDGSSDGDGSASDPWASLQDVWDSGNIESQHWTELPYEDGAQLEVRNEGAPVQPGDTIWLRDGFHGAFEVRGAYNESPIILAAEDGHVPQFSRIQLQSASNWVVRGVHVSPSFAPEYQKRTMIDASGHGYHGPAHDILIEDCTLFSVEDTSEWSAQDWVDKSASGISTGGADITVRNNTLENVQFGISASGDRAMVDGNTIENFSGDGLRGLGDDSTFQYNTVKNCYDVDDNHDDGFQSWSNGPDGVGSGEVTGMTLRGNVIINYEDPDQPHRGPLQGIGCFDGTFVDWTIENNVIITDHWHGITLLGARNATVVNNTMIDPNDTDPGPPWIKIDPHKDGTQSEDVLIRNNLVTRIATDTDQPNVTIDNNMEISDYPAHFTAADAFDLHLLETSSAIDAGVADRAPDIDIEGVPRPQGEAVDLGAYEWHDGSIGGEDGGGDSEADATDDAGGDTAEDASMDAVAATDDVGPDPGSDSGNGADEGGEDGCNCASTPGNLPASWLFALLALVAIRARRG
jgi:MYXO-CTERM domain-containing protein